MEQSLRIFKRPWAYGEGGRGGQLPQKKFEEDQIRANTSGRIGKNQFLSVIKTEKFSKIGDDEQDY